MVAVVQGQQQFNNIRFVDARDLSQVGLIRRGTRISAAGSPIPVTLTASEDVMPFLTIEARVNEPPLFVEFALGGIPQCPGETCAEDPFSKNFAGAQNCRREGNAPYFLFGDNSLGLGVAPTNDCMMPFETPLNLTLAARGDVDEVTETFTFVLSPMSSAPTGLPTPLPSPLPTVLTTKLPTTEPAEPVASPTQEPAASPTATKTFAPTPVPSPSCFDTAPDETLDPVNGIWTRLANIWPADKPKVEPEARHESSFVEANGKFYMIGGRTIDGNARDVDIWDPETAAWVENPTNAFFPNHHHFQPVVFGNQIWLANAMFGNYPNEKPLPFIWIYDTETDVYYESDIAIPRARGAGGAVVYKDTLYLMSGILNGHRSGNVDWFDSFDLAGYAGLPTPRSQSSVASLWKELPSVPNPRDHANAAVIDDKVYLAGGRLSNLDLDGDAFDDTIAFIDVFDFITDTWSTLSQTLEPPRAAAAVVAWRSKLLIIGGEGATVAHADVDEYDPATDTWTKLQPMQTGPRHGFGVVNYNDYIFIAGGSFVQGGSNMNDIVVFPQVSSSNGACAAP